MPVLTCPDCRKPAEYATLAESVECSYCGEDFDPKVEVRMMDAQTTEIDGLTLTYQISNEQIYIPTSGKILLGRENFGANVLSKIYFNGERVVSRKHCSIEFEDGAFHLRDEGSMNGTFCGENKASCKNAAHKIEDGSFVYLGEELFHARIRYKEPKKAEPAHNMETEIVTSYRCNDPNCSPSYEAENMPKTKICPQCGSFDKFVRVT